MSVRTWSHRACVAALLGLLVGCGGSSTTATTTGGNGGAPGGTSPPAPVIQGIAMPQSVAVVTATNAGS